MTLVGRFPDRAAAGRALAAPLRPIVAGPAVVLGVPNGGVAVAVAAARALRKPAGVAWVARIVRPREPDVALGAVDLDGDVTVNPEATQAEGLPGELVTELAYHAHRGLVLRAGARSRLTPSLRGKNVVLLDDGLTTGLTLIAALRWARRHGARRLVVAVPVADRMIWPHVAQHADVAAALETRDGPIARSDVYEDFRRVPDADVPRLLADQRLRRAARRSRVAR